MVLLVCFLLFVAVRLLVGRHPYHIDAREYLPFHTIVEFLSVVVSLSVFLVSWPTADGISSSYTLVLGNSLLCVGLIDLFHALTYEGMPPFIVPASANQATQYWIVARLVAAVAILAAALSKPHNRPNARRHYIGAAGAVCGATAVLALVSWQPIRLPTMYDEAAHRLTTTKVALEYLVMALNVAAIAAMAKLKRGEERTRQMLTAGLVVLVFSELSFTLYGSVFDVYNGLGHVYKLVGSWFVFQALFVTEVREPHRRLEVQKAVADRERALVEGLQQAFLPHLPSGVPGLAVEGAYQSAAQREFIGGDYYDVFHVGERRFGVVIADVAGKGVEAAVRVGMVKYMLRSFAREAAEPSTAVSRLNEAMCAEDTSGQFVTLFYGLLDLDTCVLWYTNAGHEPQLLLRADGAVEVLEPCGGIVGADAEMPFESRSVCLKSGDALLLFTDGLTEARRDGQFLGLRGVWRMAKEAADPGLGITATRLLSEVQAYAEGNLNDDAAVLLVRIWPEQLPPIDQAGPPS